MVRCADFYEKWKRHPNWCEKSTKAVEQITHYLDIVDDLIVMGVDEKLVYMYFPEHASRPITKEKDKDLKKRAFEYLKVRIENKDKVTEKELSGFLSGKPFSSSAAPHIGCPPAPKSNAGQRDEKRTSSPNLTPDNVVKTVPAHKDPEIMEQIEASKGAPSRDFEEVVKEIPLPPQLPPDAPIADKLKRDNELLNAHITQAEQYRIKQKAVHEEMDRLAVSFVALLTQGRQNILNDFKEEHKEYTTLADVFIHMIDMLAEKKVKR